MKVYIDSATSGDPIVKTERFSGFSLFRIIRVEFLFALAVFFGSCSLPRSYVPPNKHEKGALLSQGIVREFFYFIPSPRYFQSKLPLLFVLHGGGGSAEGMISLTRFTEYAESEGFIVVYPQGYGNRWNDGREIAHSLPDQLNVRDVDFLVDLRNYFIKNYQVDPNQTHVAGLSNGGFMVQRLACEPDSGFQTYSTVGAGISLPAVKSCKGNQARSVLLISGTADEVVPYFGGVVASGKGKDRVELGTTASFPETAEFWAKRSECKEKRVRNLSPIKSKGKNGIELWEYEKCKANHQVHAYTIYNGFHVWPYGFYYKSDQNYGRLSEDLDATDTIVRFILKR